MPHFADDPDADDPELLRKLRAMLRGPAAAPRRKPTLAERFGVTPAGAAADDRRGPALVRPGRRSGRD